jgi:hypothetical protein
MVVWLSVVSEQAEPAALLIGQKSFVYGIIYLNSVYYQNGCVETAGLCPVARYLRSRQTDAGQVVTPIYVFIIFPESPPAVFSA